MPDMRDVSVLVEILDRQFSYLLGQHRERLLLLVPRLMTFIKRDPHLAGVMADVSVEAGAELVAIRREDAALRESLESLWRRHKSLILQVLATDLEDEEKRRQINSYASLNSYDAALKERPTLSFEGLLTTSKDEGGTMVLLRALSHWSTWSIQAIEGASGTPPGELHELRSELEDLIALRFHHVRRFNMAACTMAGPAFERLCRVAERMNPGPPDDDVDATRRLIDWARFKNAESFAQKVHTKPPKQNEALTDDVDIACRQVSADAALLHDELRTRILLTRSRLGLVLRYAARSEAFDARRLRDLAASDTRNAERHLTLDFAKFLFDQGLTPLIDPTVGGLRPDVLHVGAGDLFYAEAKQYADDSPRSALVKAYSQVWGTWGRLRGHFDVPEAFLVVFRRSGPRVELPAVIHFRGLRLFSVLADLDKDAGSAEKHNPISLSVDELIPSLNDVE